MRHIEVVRARRAIERCLWCVGLGVISAMACSGSEELEPVTETVDAGGSKSGHEEAGAGPIVLTPQLGGLIQAIGPYVAELLVRDDGHLEAQVRDLRGNPITTEGASLTVELGGAGGGEGGPVQVVMTPEGDRFVGTIAGPGGRSSVRFMYAPPGADTVINATYPEVDLPAVEAAVEPRHQGRVSIVGDNRVEVATDSRGEVMVSVTDLRGTPVPPSEVELQQVRVITPSGPQVVDLEPRGDVFVGTLGAPPPPSFSVALDLRVKGRPPRGVYLRGYHPLPPGVLVVAPAPPPPIGPPTVEVTIGGHPGKGWAKGHYRGGHPGKGWAKGHRWGGNPGKGKGWGGGHGRGHGKR